VNIEEIKDAVAFKLGELSTESEGLMEIVSIGRADLITLLIETTVVATINVLGEQGMLK